LTDINLFLTQTCFTMKDRNKLTKYKSRKCYTYFLPVSIKLRNSLSVCFVHIFVNTSSITFTPSLQSSGHPSHLHHLLWKLWPSVTFTPSPLKARGQIKSNLARMFLRLSPYVYWQCLFFKPVHELTNGNYYQGAIVVVIIW
jgi:hypothetical protein